MSKSSFCFSFQKKVSYGGVPDPGSGYCIGRPYGLCEGEVITHDTGGDLSSEHRLAESEIN